MASLGQEGQGELEPEDDLEDSVNAGVAALVLQAQPIVKWHLEHDQPVVPGGGAQGPPMVTELTMCTFYTPTELKELEKRTQKMSGKPIPAWLLRLWEDGADSLQLSPA